jgi:DNA-directed RNA polymerase subunit M/transcription elongation factor TFIIS
MEKIINSILKEAYKAVPDNVTLEGQKIIEAHDSIKAILEKSFNLIADSPEYKKRRCHHCGHVWTYHVYCAAQSNASKCPNCGGLMSTEISNR